MREDVTNIIKSRFLACPRSRLRPEGLKMFLQKTNDLHEVSCMQEPGIEILLI